MRPDNGVACMAKLRVTPGRITNWRSLTSLLLAIVGATLLFVAATLTLSLAMSARVDWTICALLFLVSGVLFEIARALNGEAR